MENQAASALRAIPTSTLAPPIYQPYPTPDRTRGNLTQALMQSLQTDCPLRQFTEVLGIHLAMDACLLLGHHQASDTLTLALWRPHLPPQSWSLPATLPLESAPFDRSCALGLIEQFGQHPNPVPSPWFQILQSLFPKADDTDWGRALQSHHVIGVSSPTSTGVALLLSQQPLDPTDSDLALDQNLAELLAVAFHQDHLCQQAHRSIEQLCYVNHLKDDFISALSHELRTPLTSMMLAIRMLKRSDLTPDRQAMYLEILEQQCVRETSLVNDLLSLQRLEMAQESVTTSSVNLNQFVKGLVQAQHSRFAELHLDLQSDLPQSWITIETELGHLTQILEELLANVCKYAQPDSQVKLAVASTASANGPITIQLSNVGVAITPDELPYIFDKFRRGKGVTQRAIPGTGIGLALVKGLVTQLKGSITVTSEPCEASSDLWQTCFTISLPRYVSRPLAVG